MTNNDKLDLKMHLTGKRNKIFYWHKLNFINARTQIVIFAIYLAIIFFSSLSFFLSFFFFFFFRATTTLDARVMLGKKNKKERKIVKNLEEKLK